MTHAVAVPDRWRAGLALGGVLFLAAGLRLWHLTQNGFGRQYFAAGVRSMMGSLHCLVYNAFDPAGFVSMDKPPVALWLQVASARVLGFSGWSVLLPQVLEGLASVALVHHLVGRHFGRASALVAALLLALTPACVAVDRSNNTDSCLILVLLLAFWVSVRAAQTASARMLALGMALVGVGFNVKMGVALALVPTLALVYMLGARATPPGRRLLHLAGATLVLLAVSLSWVTLFDLTPASQRPYAGSTRHNSMLELALLHNGIERFAPIHDAVAPAGDAPGGTAASPAAAADARSTPEASPAPLWDHTPVGPGRLAVPHLAGQFAWCFPLAVAGAVLGMLPCRRGERLRPGQLEVVAWAGWAITYAAVFSLAGGVFHAYYLATLGPPLAALAGIGWTLLWRSARARRLWAMPALVLGALAAWQVYLEQGYVAWRAGDWLTGLLVGSAGLLSACGVAAALATRRRAGTRLPAVLAPVALAAALATPAAWALSTVLVRPNVAAPVASIAALGGADAPAAAAAPGIRSQPRARRLYEFLAQRRGTERFFLAVPNALQAAPWIVRTGEPVMAMGGYLGRDPILTPAGLNDLVARGELRFVLLGGFSLVTPDTAREKAIADWVRRNGTCVDPVLWREQPQAPAAVAEPAGGIRTPAVLFDLRPAATEGAHEAGDCG